MTHEELDELMDEFYGKEGDDEDVGVFEDNDEVAEWARMNVPALFGAVAELLKNEEEF